MGRKFFIVSNPYSGSGGSQNAMHKLKERLDREGYYYAIFLTPRSENLDEFIEENLFTDTTDVVVIGGDGTFNAALNAIHDKEMCLSFIPAGNGNDFVKVIKIGTSIEDQIETIINGRERFIDIGDCNGRKFINGVGIGFDGQIVHDNLYGKSFLSGHAKYYYYVLKILGNYQSKKFVIEMDGQRLEMKLILMAIHNGTTFGGGFKLNPTAKIDDGFLDICTIGRMSGIKRFLNIGRLSFGTHGKLKEVNFYQAKHIKIYENDSLLSHLDGELFGSPPFEISILEKKQMIRVKA
ncbi:MAG: diacylglycerol kinase family lipid kinase [Reichenbachiella sp.]